MQAKDLSALDEVVSRRDRRAGGNLSIVSYDNNSYGNHDIKVYYIIIRTNSPSGQE